jgi:hypothetical protein
MTGLMSSVFGSDVDNSLQTLYVDFSFPAFVFPDQHPTDGSESLNRDNPNQHISDSSCNADQSSTSDGNSGASGTHHFPSNGTLAFENQRVAAKISFPPSEHTRLKDSTSSFLVSYFKSKVSPPGSLLALSNVGWYRLRKHILSAGMKSAAVHDAVLAMARLYIKQSFYG